MTAADLPFEQIWFADFEYISKPGELPDVICLCARELRSGQNVRVYYVVENGAKAQEVDLQTPTPTP